MFKNKHLIAAMIITPILAVVGYMATDMLVSETPHKAEQGARYKLVAHPNCRYESGHCVLQNGNFKLTVTGQSFEDGRLVMKLASAFPLQQASLSVVRSSDELKGPKPMQIENDAQHWQLQLQAVEPQRQLMRLAVVADGAIYYGETVMPFLEYRPSFDKDFR